MLARSSPACRRLQAIDTMPLHRGWTVGCTESNTGLLLPPFGAVVVDGPSTGQLHHAVVYPSRVHAKASVRSGGGAADLTTLVGQPLIWARVGLSLSRARKGSAAP